MACENQKPRPCTNTQDPITLDDIDDDIDDTIKITAINNGREITQCFANGDTVLKLIRDGTLARSIPVLYGTRDTLEFTTFIRDRILLGGRRFIVWVDATQIPQEWCEIQIPSRFQRIKDYVQPQVIRETLDDFFGAFSPQFADLYERQQRQIELDRIKEEAVSIYERERRDAPLIMDPFGGYPEIRNVEESDRVARDRIIRLMERFVRDGGILTEQDMLMIVEPPPQEIDAGDDFWSVLEHNFD